MDMNSSEVLIKTAYKFRNHPKLFHFLRRVWHIDRATTRYIDFKGEFSVRFAGKEAFKMYHYGRASESTIENDLFWEGLGNGWEGTSLLVWMLMAQRMEMMLDVGANVGVYSLAAKFINPDAEITAFEPFELCYRRLVKNVMLNRLSIVAKKVAVSDRTGTAKLYDRGGTCLASLEKEIQSKSRRDSPLDAYVPTVRLDQYCSCVNGQVGIKIDVEGHEASVLSGLGAVLRENTPTILIEVLGEPVAKYVADTILPAGYRIYALKEGIGVYPVDSFRRVRRKDRNYLLCSPGIWMNELIGNGIYHEKLLDLVKCGGRFGQMCYGRQYA